MTNNTLTKNDLQKVRWRWYFLGEAAWNYEIMQGLGYCYSMMPVLKKLYPEKEDMKKALQTLVGALPEKTLPKADFERLKRQNIGNMIMLFNSPESIANLFIRYYFENISAFELIDTLDALTYDDVVACLKLFDLSKSTMHIVLPKKENL